MKISYAEYIKKTSVSVLVAETVFNELITSSPIKTIKDIADTASGGTPLRSNADYYNGEIPWLKSGELNDGLIEKASEFITDIGLKNSSAKLHPKKTLLVAMYGATAGKTGITNFEASTNQAVCAVFPKKEILKDYLYWFFRSHRYQFIEKSKGGAQPNISQSVIKKTFIPVPDIEMQKQIVDVLQEIETKNSIDVSIIPDVFKDAVVRILNFKNSLSGISTKLTHQLNLVKQLRQSFLREAMQGKLVEQNPNDEPATELLTKIKAEKEQLIKEKKIKKQKPLLSITKEEIPFGIPENWVWCRLGEICDTITKGSSPKWQGVKYVNSIDEGILFITSKNVDSYKIDLSNSTFVEEKFNEIEPRSILQKGDILTNIVGASIGRTAIYNLDYNANINQAVCILRYEHNLFLKEYLLKLMNSNFIIELMLEMQFSPGRANLSMSNLSKFPIALPPLSEQKRIVAKLDELMAYCNSLEESIKNSQTQNEMLLEQVLREALEPEKKEVVV